MRTLQLPALRGGLVTARSRSVAVEKQAVELAALGGDLPVACFRLGDLLQRTREVLQLALGEVNIYLEKHRERVSVTRTTL